MTELDTSILDELSRRNRRAALQRRGSRKRLSPSQAAERKPRTTKQKVRVERPKGPGTNSPQAKANARASIAARREREGDLIADALLGILTRLKEERDAA